MNCPRCSLDYIVKNGISLSLGVASHPVINGKLIRRYCRAIDIKQLRKVREKRIIQKGINNTLRQRVSRLGRKRLSFSKKLSRYIASLVHFIQHYNFSLPLSIKIILIYTLPVIISHLSEWGKRSMKKVDIFNNINLFFFS